MQFNHLRSELQSFIASFEINNGNNTNEYWNQNSDQLWINCWTSQKFNENQNKREVSSSGKEVEKISINEFSMELKSVMEMSRVFDEKINNLNHNIDNLDEETWHENINQINSDKQKIEQLISSIQRKTPSIKLKLNQIKRKRISKSNRNMTYKQLNQQYIQTKNKIIDEWFEGKRLIRDRIKREKDMKKEADIVLVEVRKKISDAKRYLKKVSALEKARNAIKNSAQQRSLFTTTESDSVFTNQISQMKTLLKERIETYYKEESALKSMIESEFEKRFNEKLSDETDVVFNELNQKQLHIYESLFGSNQFPEPNNLESLINWQYYEQSHHSIDNMIRIRHLWDRYLNNSEGTCIPKNYIFPTNTSNSSWNKYIQK